MEQAVTERPGDSQQKQHGAKNTQQPVQASAPAR
jgi:hypothetical protein